jgi:hypothetical protein
MIIGNLETESAEVPRCESLHPLLMARRPELRDIVILFSNCRLESRAQENVRRAKTTSLQLKPLYSNMRIQEACCWRAKGK